MATSKETAANPAREEWWPQPRIRKWFGNPHPTTWWRWIKDDPNFPKPRFVNGRAYYQFGPIADWWASRTGGPTRVAAAKAKAPAKRSRKSARRGRHE